MGQITLPCFLSLFVCCFRCSPSLSSCSVAQNPEAALAFLTDMRDRLAPLRADELRRLAALKEQEALADASARTGDVGASNAAVGAGAGGEAGAALEEWDVAYFSRVLKEREAAVDQEAVRQCVHHE